MKRSLAVVAVLVLIALSTVGIYAAHANRQCPMQGRAMMSTGPMQGKAMTSTCPMQGKAMMSTCPMQSACCGGKTCDQPAAQNAATVSAVCPVMGTKIPDVTKAAGQSVYKGKTYYFCCASCKPLFDKNPEKYIAPPPPAKP